jgi:DNA repair protein RecN (Recombination protein N)
VLCELRVENLLLIERAELCLADGLNVLTGETGAGKTVLAQALDLLMGGSTHPGRPRAGIVRPGCEAAYAEAVFAPPPATMAELAEHLPDNVREEVEQTGELILARRVGADGRTRCYVGGRAASVAHLRALGSRLISFYGQHEHRRLVLAGAQRQMLDGVCGASHAERLRACAASWRETRRLREELDRLAELAEARERELGLLEHELTEIEQAQPDEAEYARLTARRDRLRGVEGLRRAAGVAAEALEPESAELPGAAQLLAGAAAGLRAAAGIDAELDALAERSEALGIEARDLAGELRGYLERIDTPLGARGGSEGELQALEERLAELERLARKHGGTIAAVCEYAEHARARAQELSGAERAQGQASALLEDERRMLREHAGALRSARRDAAERLQAAVGEQLVALAMPDARFSIALSETELGASGGDAVEFLLAANPGVDPAPLREIASGGELSRAMLALASACEQLGDAAPSSTLVFDEIDAGIGGHTARAVGERLQTLARGRQVICITHLPQIASLADRHFSVVKDTGAELTLATVTQLDERDVEGELVRMLGADSDDAGARRHARALRRAA